MQRRGETSTREERLRMVDLAQQGWTDAQIAQHMGCSRWTVRQWRRTFNQHGARGLTSHMGRPRCGILGTLPPHLRQAILALRQSHPGWGPATIVTELRRDQRWRASDLPSRARLAAFFQAQGCTRPYQRHAVLPQPAPQVAQAPHEEWQLDAQGWQEIAGVGRVTIINIADMVSRLKVESYPHLWGTAPDRDTYQFLLRRAFTVYGLPERISVDHDSVFYENVTPSPFPAGLHLWLLALGIDVVFIRRHCPTDHAVIDREHQVMAAHALAGQQWPTATALWAGLDQRREILNHDLPTAGLNGQTPRVAFPAAQHSGRPYQPAWEETVLDLDRVYRYLSEGRGQRATNCHGEFWLGLQRYNAGRRYAKRTLTLTFDAGTGSSSTKPIVRQRSSVSPPRA
jgi:transposase-like protein